MTHLPRLLILAAGMLMAVGCSDSRTATVADASQKKDTTLGDQGRADGAPTPDAPASDAPRKDAAPARDQATRDAAPADLPTPVDSTSRDATPVDSTNRDATALDQSTPTKDGGGTTCATDQDCKVFEDCCECTAVFKLGQPADLQEDVLRHHLHGARLHPTHRLLRRRPLPADRGRREQLQNDKDCQKIDNCCDCLALPTSVAAPTCNMGPCFVNTCVGQGLATAAVQCVGGTCKLVP